MTDHKSHITCKSTKSLCTIWIAGLLERDPQKRGDQKRATLSGMAFDSSQKHRVSVGILDCWFARKGPAIVGLALALLGAGCSEIQAPSSWSGRVDVSALPDDHAAIFELALGDWRKASGGRVTAQTAVGGTPVVFGDVGEGHGGLYVGDALRVLPCDTATPEGYDACYQVAAHELGHWFEAQHVSRKDAIMYKDCTGATAITPDDLAALKAAVGE